MINSLIYNYNSNRKKKNLPWALFSLLLKTTKTITILFPNPPTPLGKVTGYVSIAITLTSPSGRNVIAARYKPDKRIKDKMHTIFNISSTIINLKRKISHLWLTLNLSFPLSLLVNPFLSLLLIFSIAKRLHKRFQTDQSYLV